jgi:hypothetical protein
VVDRGVVRDQDARRLQGAARSVRFAGGGRGQPDAEVERAAAADLALDPDRPAHQRHELRGDGEPEAGAAELPRARPVGLDERLEDGFPPLGRNADAGVAHDPVERHLARLLPFLVEVEHDVAAGGELHRVAHQVEQELAEPPVVPHHGVGNVRRHPVRDLETLAVGGDAHAADRLGHDVAQQEGTVLEVEAAGLDLREVQDAVDHREQALRGPAHHRQVVALHEGDRRRQQELGQPDDPVHGRADLVAHVGQELALRPVRALGGLGGGLLVLDVGAGRVPLLDRARGVADRQRPREVPPVFAVGSAPEAELGFVADALLHRGHPGVERILEVVGVKHLRPVASEVEAGPGAGVVEPALVAVVDPPVRARGPDDLRHGIGELVPAPLAGPQLFLGEAASLVRAGERIAAPPDEGSEAHHDRAGEQKRSHRTVVDTRALAREPSPTDDHGDHDHDGEEPAGGEASRVVGHDHVHDSSERPGAQQADTDGEEPSGGVEGHL